MTLKEGLKIAIPTTAIVLTVAEMCSYCYLFYYVWKHDNKEAARLLSENIIRKRNRANALSLMGNFSTWLVNMIYVIGAGFVPVLFSNSVSVKEVTSFLKFFDYLVVPFVQIKTSPPLRRFVESKK